MHNINLANTNTAVRNPRQVIHNLIAGFFAPVISNSLHGVAAICGCGCGRDDGISRVAPENTSHLNMTGFGLAVFVLAVDHYDRPFKWRLFANMNTETIMSDISIYMQNGQATVTSLEVSNHYNKRHDNVLRIIEQIIEEASEFSHLNFEAAEYLDGQSKPRKMYEMTRDGFTLLSNRFTGKKALQFQIRFIQAFNQMESVLENRAGHTTLPNHQTLALSNNKKYMLVEMTNGTMTSQTEIDETVLYQFVVKEYPHLRLFSAQIIGDMLDGTHKIALRGAAEIKDMVDQTIQECRYGHLTNPQQQRAADVVSRLDAIVEQRAMAREH